MGANFRPHAWVKKLVSWALMSTGAAKTIIYWKLQIIAHLNQDFGQGYLTHLGTNLCRFLQCYTMFITQLGLGRSDWTSEADHKPEVPIELCLSSRWGMFVEAGSSICHENSQKLPSFSMKVVTSFCMTSCTCGNRHRRILVKRFLHFFTARLL